VIDAPGGGGKIPVMPNYILTFSTNKVILRNYQGVITTYKEPDSYEPVFCNRDCNNCTLSLKTRPAEEWRARGIEKLLSDYDETITLTPKSSRSPSQREKGKKE
jgi:lysine 2,3-aminomutase